MDFRVPADAADEGEVSVGQLRDASNDAVRDTPDGATSREHAISTGIGHTCTVTKDSFVACWGQNDQGQTGAAASGPILSPSRVQVVSDVVEVAAGGLATCARIASGTVWCWGDNRSGQLGNGSSSSSHIPQKIAAPVDVHFAAVRIGLDHACALDTNGQIWCWGKNASGKLGIGTTTDSLVPVAIPGLVASQLDTGTLASCAVRRLDRKTVCWGSNAAKEINNSTAEMFLTPTEVPNAPLAVDEFSISTDFSASGSPTERVLARVGMQLYSWGAGLPVVQEPGSVAKGVSIGIIDWCAIVPSGAVRCFGVTPNYARNCANFPCELFPAASEVTEVSIAGNFGCILQKNGAVQCFGSCESGQIGNGQGPSACSRGPEIVPGAR